MTHPYEIGYQRINPHPADDAVVWWFIRRFDDGYVYARGGSVSTIRKARHLLRQHHQISDREHARVEDRPVAILNKDGSLGPVDYGPYGAMRQEEMA